MKSLLKILAAVLTVSACAACSNIPKDTIGGADGPTKIFVAGDNNKQSGATDFLNDIIIDRNKGGYLSGECIGAGHVVLGTDTDGENTVYYLVTSYGEYGFENGRLVKVSGSGAIPVRITLDRSGNLADYKEPLDGSGYLPSLKEMFPKKYVNMVNSDEGKYYEQCRAQEEVYALRYLAQINRRDAEVGVDTEEYDKYYPLPDMAVEASNTLLNRYYDYPYWIGTQERVEDGIRYVYEKKWENHGGGDGIVSYIKSRYDNGQICERTVLEIKNGEIQYLEGTPRPDRN